MYNHAPESYICPFCLLVAGVVNEHVWSVPDDIVYRSADVTAFVGAKQWPNNPGHVLIIPNRHFENLFDLPVELGGRIHEVARKIALAMKAVYRCDGVSTRQHNEPAGNQDVWHYHLHVFPRYTGDALYSGGGKHMEPAERKRYAERLRSWLNDNAIATEEETTAPM